jgi:hypothetical protein
MLLNKSVAIIHTDVERIFDVSKRAYVLYRGIERLCGDLFMIAKAYNLRRAVTIVAPRDGLAARIARGPV